MVEAARELSVTTIGAIAGGTMREYMASPSGSELFNRTYDEALKMALAAGAQPETMFVGPIRRDGALTASRARSGTPGSPRC